MMLTNRQLFQKYLAPTSDAPVALEIERAEGVYMYDTQGKAYIDLISGVSVSNVGHRHPYVVNAIKNQLDQYMHLMVYGEYIQAPQVQLAKALVELLPKTLNSVYLVNSGSEANEGALKLAKRITGRPNLIGFKNAYHGSTHGALSLLGDELFKNAFRPLLPGVKLIQFNKIEDLVHIDEQTAAVLVEPIQGEAGIIEPKNEYLTLLRKRCDEVGAMLIFDEVQTAFGRTGKMFAFEHYGVSPDIITLAKGLGAGMPIGAFVASSEHMAMFTHQPILGHITTFGGHPVSAASALAGIEVIRNENLIASVDEKGLKFKKGLTHTAFKSIRGKGLFLAVELESSGFLKRFFKLSLDAGVVFDWFLFEDRYFRISPPLTITFEEIDIVCQKLNKAAQLTQITPKD